MAEAKPPPPPVPPPPGPSPSVSSPTSVSIGVNEDEKAYGGKRFTNGPLPIWRHPAFADMFFDSLRGTNTKSKPLAPGAFTASIELLSSVYSNIVSGNSDWLTCLAHPELAAFTLTLPVMAEAKVASSRQHANSRSDVSLYEAVADIHGRIQSLSVGSFMLIPGGWTTGEVGHNVMYVVHKLIDSFTFAVVNTSKTQGLKYHPFFANPDLYYKMVLYVDKIPPHKLLDGSFWFILMRMMVLYCHHLLFAVCAPPSF